MWKIDTFKAIAYYTQKNDRSAITTTKEFVVLLQEVCW